METKYITTISESEIFIFENKPIYVWDKLSSITDEQIEVNDPVHNKKHIFNIWLLYIENKELKFAIGEFSNSIYGVFLIT